MPSEIGLTRPGSRELPPADKNKPPFHSDGTARTPSPSARDRATHLRSGRRDVRRVAAIGASSGSGSVRRGPRVTHLLINEVAKYV